MDKGKALRTEVLWARILVKMNGKKKPSSINILAGARSYELQIWWEIQPWVVEVFPLKNRAHEGCADPVEEDAWQPRAAGRIPVGTVGRNHLFSKESPYKAAKGQLKRQETTRNHTLQFEKKGVSKARQDARPVRDEGPGSKPSLGRLTDVVGLSKETRKGKGPSSSPPSSNEKALKRVGLSSNSSPPLVFKDGPTLGMDLFSKGQSLCPIQLVGDGLSKSSINQDAAKRSLSRVFVASKEGASSPNFLLPLKSSEIRAMEDHHPRERKESQGLETEKREEEHA